jgi:hypothetical protein
MLYTPGIGRKSGFAAQHSSHDDIAIRKVKYTLQGWRKSEFRPETIVTPARGFSGSTQCWF